MSVFVLQIEAQAVEAAQMLERFEGSVAALREIERQYAQLQVCNLFHPSLSTCMVAYQDKATVCHAACLPQNGCCIYCSVLSKNLFFYGALM